MCGEYDVLLYSPHLPVPAGSLAVETEVSESGPVETGSTDVTLTCAVGETIPGLTNMPSAHWIMKDTGPVLPRNGTVIEPVRNARTAISTLSFPSLLTSPPVNISNSTPPISVTVSCELSSLSLYCNFYVLFMSVPDSASP